MWRITLALAALLLWPAVAQAGAPLAPRADCQAGIAAAMRRAYALPPTAGRAALLEQIQRADVARHEDDKDDCAEQLAMATAVLDQIDAAKKAVAAKNAMAKKAAAPAPEVPAKGAVKGPASAQ